MGWWRIDPQTGMPLKGASSALSRPPDFVLLNAVPGVDNQPGACYLGDGPSDVVFITLEEIDDIIDANAPWSADEMRALFSENRVPARLGAQAATRLRRAVDEFWAEIGWCYEDDWERPAQPSEKRWICEELVDRVINRGD